MSKPINEMQNEKFQIIQMDDGIYLSVSSPVEIAIIFKELRKRKITVFKSENVFTAVQEVSNQPIWIADLIQTTVEVLVRRDRMEAVINVVTPPSAPPVTMEQILEKLHDANIVYGIDQKAIEYIIKARSTVEITCATATLPIEGNKAFLKYHVDIESQGRPTILEDGSVDFKNINSFINVKTGQLLIEKIPPTPGTPGKDVLGLPIPSKPGKDISMPNGKNMTLVDNCKLVAAIDGQLHVAHNRIDVLPTIEVNEDIDYSTGNIDFIGNVIVHGSVQPGFSIKAGGNVEIRGTICGGMVEASNIIVRRGIQGMNRSVIKATNKVMAKFIENATVYADMEVLVSDVILNSSIFSGMRVIVEGRRGRVLGGRISAGEEIHIRTVGNLSHIATDLEVATNPFLRDELHSLKAENKRLRALFEELKLSIAYNLAYGINNLNAEKKERHEQMEVQLNDLPTRLEEIKQRRIDIDVLLHSAKPGKIRISDVIYPGVRVSIGTLSKSINDALKYLALYVHEGEIKFSSFK